MFNGNIFLDEYKNVLLLNVTFNSLGSVRLFDVFEKSLSLTKMHLLWSETQ